MSGSWSNPQTSLIILVEQISGFSGIFGYSPAPAMGTLIFSLAAFAGTDPYGNTFGKGLNVGDQAGLHFGVDTSGDMFMFNSSGVRTFFGQASTGNLTIGATAGNGFFKFDEAADTLTYTDASAVQRMILGGAVPTKVIAATAAGAGIAVKEGSNARMGTAVLAAGTATVANTSVTASTRIALTSQADGGAPGFLRVSTRTAGTSFTITSSSATDTSTVMWLMVEPY